MAVEHGASALGLVSDMPSGPGVIAEDLIAEIAASIPPPIESVLLTSKHHAEAIIEQQRRTRVSAIQIVDRLERGGYVRRERSREDGRRVDLRLTPAGVRIKRQQNVLEPELVEAMLERLDRDRQRQALAGLELLADAARDMIASGNLNRFLRGGAK